MGGGPDFIQRLGQDILTGGLAELSPGVRDAVDTLPIIGSHSKVKAAQAQQQKSFQDAINAYQQQRQTQDNARLAAMRASVGAMSPVSDVLKRMYGPQAGLQMGVPSLPGIGGPPPGPAVGAPGGLPVMGGAAMSAAGPGMPPAGQPFVNSNPLFQNPPAGAAPPPAHGNPWMGMATMR